MIIAQNYPLWAASIDRTYLDAYHGLNDVTDDDLGRLIEVDRVIAWDIVLGSKKSSVSPCSIYGQVDPTTVLCYAETEHQALDDAVADVRRLVARHTTKENQP